MYARSLLPGVLANNFNLTSIDTVLSEIALTSFGVVLPPRFHVGVAFTQAEWRLS